MKSRKSSGGVELPERTELIDIRSRLRLTQAEMAAELAISTSTLEKYEYGKRRLHADRMAEVRALAAARIQVVAEAECEAPPEVARPNGQQLYDRTMTVFGTIFAGAAFIMFLGAFLPDLMPARTLTAIGIILVAFLSPLMCVEVWRRICLGYPPRFSPRQGEPG